jgi:hypothetical protein
MIGVGAATNLHSAPLLLSSSLTAQAQQTLGPLSGSISQACSTLVSMAGLFPTENSCI